MMWRERAGSIISVMVFSPTPGTFTSGVSRVIYAQPALHIINVIRRPPPAARRLRPSRIRTGRARNAVLLSPQKKMKTHGGC